MQLVVAGGDEIHAMSAERERVGQLSGVLQQPAARSALDDGDAHAARVARPSCLHSRRMTPAPALRIVCVAPGDPLAPHTWSAISPRLLAALDAEGVLAGAVGGRPAALSTLEKAASFSPASARWRQRYNAGASPLSPLIRAAMSAVATRRARRAADGANVLLQLTGWYSPGRLPGPGPTLRCAYHDGNLATYLRRPDLLLRPALTSGPPRAGVRAAAGGQHRRHPPDERVAAPLFVEDYGQPEEKVVSVGAGPGFAALPDPVDRDFGRPRFLFVGKDFRRKGGPQLLDAFREVQAARPEAELLIVGPLEPPPPQPGVVFLGRLDRSTPAGAADLDRAFRTATAFAMPSLYEPFGLVFLEAMAYQLPCVAALSCAMPEIVEDGVSGYVVPAEDAERLAERLLALTDAGRARAMGDAGHRRFLERYTWPAVARRIVDVAGQRLANSASIGESHSSNR